MARKKELNPMEAFRRKQKKSAIAKNKKKRTESKDKALKRKDADSIMCEIQKLNRREKQDRGKNAAKHENRRKKLVDAYDRAIRIEKIKSRTLTKKGSSQGADKSPTPPPIEDLVHATADVQTANDRITQYPNVNAVNAYYPVNPATINPYSVVVNPCSPHVPQRGPAMYSDALTGNTRRQQHDCQQFSEPPQVIQKQLARVRSSSTSVAIASNKKKLEVIMDPKLKQLRPSSMRFKRKFDNPKQVLPNKKRKLDIAPDVDGGTHVERSTDSVHASLTNADAAYDKFMDEISGLL